MRTAYPRSTSRLAFQRHDHPAQVPSGPPCTNTTSGAGVSADAPAGRSSHEPISTPSSAVALTRSRSPVRGSSPAGVAGERSSTGSWSAARASSRTTCGGRSGWDRNAYTVVPSGDTHTSLNAAPPASRIVAPLSSSQRKMATPPRSSAVNRIARPSGVQSGEIGQRSASLARTVDAPSSRSTTTSSSRCGSSGAASEPRTSARRRPSGEKAGELVQSPPRTTVRRSRVARSMTTMSVPEAPVS